MEVPYGKAVWTWQTLKFLNKNSKQEELKMEELWSFEDRNYNLWAHADEYDTDNEGQTPCERGEGNCKDCPCYATCFGEKV